MVILFTHCIPCPLAPACSLTRFIDITVITASRRDKTGGECDLHLASPARFETVALESNALTSLTPVLKVSTFITATHPLHSLHSSRVHVACSPLTSTRTRLSQLVLHTECTEPGAESPPSVIVGERTNEFHDTVRRATTFAARLGGDPPLRLARALLIFLTQLNTCKKKHKRQRQAVTPHFITRAYANRNTGYTRRFCPTVIPLWPAMCTVTTACVNAPPYQRVVREIRVIKRTRNYTCEHPKPLLFKPERANAMGGKGSP